MADQSGSYVAQVLTGIFGDHFLLIIFLVLIVFLMENQSFFQKEISILNSKIGSFRTLLDAVTATVGALQAVVNAPSTAMPPEGGAL